MVSAAGGRAATTWPFLCLPAAGQADEGAARDLVSGYRLGRRRGIFDVVAIRLLVRGCPSVRGGMSPAASNGCGPVPVSQ